MDWSTKIDNKKYGLGTLIALLVTAFVTKGKLPDAIYLLTVTMGSVLNQWLMFLIFGKVFNNITQNTKFTFQQKIILGLQVALKFIMLGSLFYLLIVHARHVVAQGLILYTFQLIILILSIKNITASMKKGSDE